MIPARRYETLDSMRPFLKHLGIAIVIFLALSGLFAFFTTSGEQPEEIALTTLAAELQEGSVKTIRVEDNAVHIEKTDGAKQITRKESGASLTETLGNLGVSQAALNAASIEVKEPGGARVIAGTILPFLIPFILILGLLWFMMRQAQKGNVQALSFGQSRARLSNPFAKKKVTFADVAGDNEAKDELGEVVEFLREPQKFFAIGARIPRGVILVGPPGTGKTLLARAVAGEANVPFFYISGSDFVEMFVGVGASRVRDLFEKAKKSAPAIVFIDELDAVGRHRGAGLGGGHDEREQTLNQILVEMDGFEQETNVIIIAATNRPDILDPALLRPGRFDRRVMLDLPDINDREAILRIHTRDVKMEAGVNIRQVAQRTPGFSGADLANLVNEAAILSARREKKSVGQPALLESIEKVMLGPERKSHLLNEQERRIAAYHEAGHALVASQLTHADPVHKVSIVSRGRAGGFTLKLPLEDRHFRSRTEFLADLAVALGGYAAEETVFGDITTGASNDLERATQAARNLITRYGMSKVLGPVTFGEKDELVFLGKELGEMRNYSEKIAEQIDAEIRAFMEGAHQTARVIIKRKRTLLERIAAKLLEQETLEREEFEQLIGAARRSPAAAPTPNAAPAATPEKGNVESLAGIGRKTAAALRAAGYSTIESIASASLQSLLSIRGVGKATARKLLKEARLLGKETKQSRTPQSEDERQPVHIIVHAE